MKNLLKIIIVVIVFVSLMTGLWSCKKVTLPKIATKVVTEITTTTAISGGIVTNNGGSEVTTRGVCWSTISGPTIMDSHTSEGPGANTFTSSITGLTANTTYYIRAYATNNIGTGYGDEITFITSKVVLATVTTTQASGITSYSASSGGNVTDDGGGTITARGVCYGTTANPLVTGNKTSEGSGTGTFGTSITGLQPGTLYYYRAYATNSAGTAYGDEHSFTTVVVEPTVTTAEVTGISTTGAISGGNVTASGGATITARGVCWCTNSNPSISDAHTSDGTGTGSFTSSITGLTGNTIYYVRAYATNILGTAYGDQVSFKTTFPNCGTVTDIDGNVYNTVIIGTQCWMAENLKTSKFNDGTEITFEKDSNSVWFEDQVNGKYYGSYCWYNYDPGFKDVYGALYNCGADRLGKLCPVGWHVSTNSDWVNMLKLFDPNASRDHACASQIAGGSLKSTGTIEEGTGLWHTPNTGATNESGFSGLPGGRRSGKNHFSGMGNIGMWWIEVEERYLLYNSNFVAGSETCGGGFSVRCVKD